MPADRPRLTRSGPAPKPGIVHLGLGAFFRAFGAVYLHELMQAQGGDWGIVGVSLRSPDTRAALAPQDGAYTCVVQGPDGEAPQLIESVVQVLVAPEDPAAVLAAMAAPETRIVTLTITEKGYCHEPSTGRLNRDHPDIVHDIAEPLPRSAPGYLVRALERRRGAGLAPFTVLTCDNLPHNGPVVRGVVLELARAIDNDLADWIAAQGRFPATMVDRITPATSDEDAARVAEATGRYDAAPVMTEPFRQWVVEDDFVGGERPDLGAVGVQMVADVTPFELMKLRMLNGTHSSLAYLGYLAGYETIAETVADPVFERFVRYLWQFEIVPAVAPPPGEDLSAYADALLERYRNPAIRHRTWQIAMDGSQKLPQRLLGTVQANRAAGRPTEGIALAVAAWMHYVRGTDLAGAPIDVRDPLADRLRELVGSAEGAGAAVAALLGVREVFSPGLADDAGWREQLTAAHRALSERGARAAVMEVTQ